MVYVGVRAMITSLDGNQKTLPCTPVRLCPRIEYPKMNSPCCGDGGPPKFETYTVGCEKVKVVQLVQPANTAFSLS